MSGAWSGWEEMIAALAMFFTSHMIPARPPIRRWLRARLRPGLYMTLYSGLSLAILIWLIVAAGRAPYVEIWPVAPWQLWVPNLVMPLVCLLIAFGVAAPNPFSIAGRAAYNFDPDRPGIAGVTRHPLIWGLTLWARAHLVPNGDLAHVVLFGLFAAFGLIGMAAIDARRRRAWGRAVWDERAARTSFLPFAAILGGRTGMPRPSSGAAPRLLAAAGFYVVLILLHPLLTGVSPAPPL